ncbi:MAG: nitroreductase [Gammaproteobacteria bacterium]
MNGEPVASLADPLIRLLGARRTIHDFAPAEVSRARVIEAIEAACWAPNHHRTEPWRFYLLSREIGLQVADLNAELVRAKKGDEAADAKRRRWREMPGWLVLTCTRGDDAAREREDYAACCCAAQNLALALWVHGIGTKWGTGTVTRDPRFLALIGADPAREFVVGLFWYGFPAAVPRQVRKPVTDVLRIVE